MIDAFAVEPRRIFQRHRLRLSEHQAHHLLRDDDGVFAIGGVVHVVRIINRNGLAFFAGGWINGGQTVSLVVENPQPGHVVRRSDVLGLAANLDRFDHLVSCGIDHTDGIALRVGNIHTRWKILYDRAQSAGTIRGVNVMGVE